ncbi:MAG: putative hydrolase [Ilumatobacteraceae bacterium]|nr:putative hydrolase [Ilumatobacteraceae bacterium]
MPRTSAGLLLHRVGATGLEVLLVHPGGPFWAKKDDGAWSIPKGEHDDGEDPLACALREFEEELGSAPPLPPDDEPDRDLGEIRLKSGKRVRGFARPGTLDVAEIRSNTFEQEWPPRSGRMQAFPEVDRAAWFTVDQARVKLNPAQVELVDRLEAGLAHPD